MSDGRMRQKNRERLARTVALALVLVVTTILRVWRLESMPPGLYHDEAYNGLDALSLTQGKTFPQFYEGWELYAAEAHADRPAQESRWPVFFEGNYGREPLHIYLMAAAIQTLGASVFAIRIVPALAGIISVLTTYMAARELTRRTGAANGAGSDWGIGARVLLDPALIAALAMAILFPAVHFSRFGIRAVLFVPLATVAVTFFWRGINKAAVGGNASRIPIGIYFLIAGVFMGLGFYSYAAARLFPLVFVIFVPYWFWRDREAMRRHWRHVATMAVVALVTALPLLLFFVRYPYYFVFRIAYVANKGTGTVEGRPWLTWLGNTWRVTRGLFLYGETHLRHNLPGRPFMDAIQATFFLAGGVVTIRQRGRLQWAFLWLWLLVMLLPSILSGDAPHFGRLLGAAPAMAILIGIGWVGIGQIVLRRFSTRGAGLLIAVLAVLLLGSVIWTWADYFGRYASHPDLSGAYYEPDFELGNKLAEYGEDAMLYLTPTQEELATIYYALKGPERLTDFSGREGLAPLGIPGQPSVFAVRPWAEAYVQELEMFLPGGVEVDRQSSYILYYVSAEHSNPPIPNETNVNWADTISLLGWEQRLQGEQLVIRLFWQAERPVNEDYTAFVHVLDEQGSIVTQNDRPPTGHPTSNWREGEIIADSFELHLPDNPQSGRYSLQTGFYNSETVALLGKPAELGAIMFDREDS